MNKCPECNRFLGSAGHREGCSKSGLSPVRSDSFVRSDSLLAAWDSEIDKLREMAVECRMTQNVQRAVFLEGKACGYAQCYREVDAANRILTNSAASAPPPADGSPLPRRVQEALETASEALEDITVVTGLDGGDKARKIARRALPIIQTLLADVG
jgi:hypothetical protein